MVPLPLLCMILDLQKKLAGGLSAFEILLEVSINENKPEVSCNSFTYVVCPCNILKRVGFMDLNVQLVLDNELPQFIHVSIKLLSSDNVSEKCWPAQLNNLRAQTARNSISSRSAAAEQLGQSLLHLRNCERRYRAACISEANKGALPRQRSKRHVERSLSHTIKRGDDAHSAGDLLHPLLNILVRTPIVNHLHSAIFQRQLRLFRRAYRSNSLPTHSLDQLQKQKTNAASSCMNKDPIILLYLVGLADERESCKALEQRRGCNIRRDCSRDLGGMQCWCGCVLGIRSRRHVHNTVADREAMDIA